MSVIVAVSDGKRVCMACDSLATNNGSAITLADPKIVRRGPMLFGPCDGPTIQAIKYMMPEQLVENAPADLAQWAVVEFVPWLRAHQKEQVILEVEDGQHKLRSRILVAHRGDVVDIDPLGYAVRSVDGIVAYGSGWCEARAAIMGAKVVKPDLAADNLAILGVGIAIETVNGCGPPIVHEWTEP